MGKYQMTIERAKRVLAFRGVPSREAGMIDLLKASGLEYLSGNGLKRGYYLNDVPPVETVVGGKKPKSITDCPRDQLYAATKRMYDLALSYAPKIAQDHQKNESLQSNESRCSVEWRRKLRSWLNMDSDQAADFSTADLEELLCGE